MLSLPPTVFSSSTRPGRRSAQKSFRRGTGLIPSFSNFCKRPDGSYFGASSFSMALSTDWTVFRSSTVLYIASLFFFCSEMLESFLAGSRFDSSSHPGSICRTCPLFPPGCAEPAPRGDRRYQSRSKKQNVAEQKIPLEQRRAAPVKAEVRSKEKGHPVKAGPLSGIDLLKFCHVVSGVFAYDSFQRRCAGR